MPSLYEYWRSSAFAFARDSDMGSACASTSFLPPIQVISIQAWIQKYGDGKGGVTYNGIIAANDQMALGAMEALKGANIELGTGEGQVMISGIDGTAEALQAVKDGQMAQTVLQDAPGQGAAAVDVIKTYMAGEKPDAEVLVPYVSVTAENVDEYLK